MLNLGDHACALYSSDDELADIAAEFLADGVQRHERCWYLPAADNAERVCDRLRARGVNVKAQTARSGLAMLGADAVYDLRGQFDPEATLAAFNDAIEQAIRDGFSGFRAAANMSWALDRPDTVDKLIVYEALLRSLFVHAPARGLCLYDSRRMPLDVVNGALCTHPVIRTSAGYEQNVCYDPAVTTLSPADPSDVHAKLARIGLRSDANGTTKPGRRPH